jgi:hypothetical protein
MTVEQLIFHFFVTGWLLFTTYQRLVLTSKKTNIIALTALRLLAVGSVICFLAPIYLWLKFPNFIQSALHDSIYVLIWIYILLIGMGAVVQTVFGIFWTTKQAQKIYNQHDNDPHISTQFKPTVVPKKVA